jgi:hypothetical protein
VPERSATSAPAMARHSPVRMPIMVSGIDPAPPKSWINRAHELVDLRRVDLGLLDRHRDRLLG